VRQLGMLAKAHGRPVEALFQQGGEDQAQPAA